MYNAIPISFRNNTLTIATSHPERLEVLDELRNFLGYNIQATVTTKGEIDSALERYYASNEGDSVESIMSELANDKELLEQAMAEENGELDLASAEAMAESAPVRKLLNTVFLLGIKDKASDLHFEPFEDEFKIRIKADGTLYEMVPPPRHLASAITTRIRCWRTSTSPKSACRRTGASGCSSPELRSTSASASCRRCSARASSAGFWTRASFRST
jgi:type IV pilus assembly protein PilB